MKDFPDFVSKDLNIKRTLSKIVNIREDERTKARTILSLLTVSLLIVLVSSVGIIQNNTAIAASNTIFKQKFKDSFARAVKITTEGNIITQLSAEAHKDLSGNTVVTLFLQRTDKNTGTPLTIFFGSGPGQLTIGGGLSSATFSGTVTGPDFVTGEDKTATVNSQLSATGKVRTSTFGSHESTRDVTQVIKIQGSFRPASGSVTISGDLTFSSDGGGGGLIGIAKQGLITVNKH
jgi:hypothetical protein